MKKGWQIRKLGDVCQIRGGGTPSKAVARYWQGDVPWVSPKDMKSEVILDTIDHVSKEAIDSSATSLIPTGSVLMVVRSGILARTIPIGITGRELTINQDLKALCPHGAIDARFLYHLLHSKMDELLAMVSRGATVHRLMSEQIRSLDLPVPPLAEQQRIVALLDEAFAGLATAQANAARNLQNARALFESHLQAVFTQRGEGWVERTLEEVAADDCSLSYGIVQPGDDVEGGLPVVRPTDLTQDTIRLSGLKRIAPARAESYQRTTLQGFELLICVRGTTGVVSKASAELAGANVTRGIVPIRFKNKLMKHEFGFHMMRALPVQSQIRDKTYGAALMQINIGDLRKILVTFPSVSEQQAIASQLDALSSETQRLTRIYEQKQSLLAELKKSLLHQAFTGML
jgi:type I restriction enzyme S subunit